MEKSSDKTSKRNSKSSICRVNKTSEIQADSVRELNRDEGEDQQYAEARTGEETENWAVV